jgi:DNA-binding protein HU-beta
MTAHVLTTCAAASSICQRTPEDRVIKLDIVNAVLRKFEEEGVAVSRVKAEQAVETVFESLKNAMGRGQRIELRRFGVFSVRPRKTGIGRNPRTGEEVSIPPGKVVRFKPGKELQGMEDTAAAGG